MKIYRVKPDGEIDQFGGRALRVQTNRITIKTPQRVLTSSEFQYKANLPFEPPLNNEISEIVCQFQGKKWDSFLNTNGSFDSRLRTLDFFSDKMAYTLRRFYPQLPTAVKVDDCAIKQLLELQRMSALDFISLPNIPQEIDNYDRTTSSFAEEVLSENREPLPYLDMALDIPVFRERFTKLLELSQTGLIHSIGLIYRPIRKFIVNYRLLWENREAEVFLQMSNVPREFSRTIGTSAMHLLQKWGIDSFSVKIGRFVPPTNGEPEPLPRSKVIGHVKRFDPEPIQFRPFNTWGNRHDPLNCNCPVCGDTSVGEFKEKYDSENEEYPGQVFNSANRLHEYYQSSQEFTVSREFIRKGELDEYFNGKDGLRRSDMRVPPHQETLNGYPI